MRFYMNQHKYYCGIDLHSRVMHVCVSDGNGKKQLHRNMRNDRAYFLKLIAPYRANLTCWCQALSLVYLSKTVIGDWH